MEKYFAAFIMTYERASILHLTIEKILNQTYPPEKILVVDNSESLETRNLIERMNYSVIDYYRVGYNAGPAGAAKIGLQILAEQGYDWIYWGDDDDPPKSRDCFERLLMGSTNLKNPGIIGAVGHRINRRSLVIQRTPDKWINDNAWLDVDVISGGMCMIVNADVVHRGVIPDDKLFYGFEELDFCFRVKQAGFELWANSELFKIYRKFSKRSPEVVGKRGLKRPDHAIWREYYSTRNILIIAKKQRYNWAGFFVFIKSLFKIFYGFRFGLSYGMQNGKYIYLGLKDYLIGLKGRRTFI